MHYSTMYIKLEDKTPTDYRVDSKQAVNDIIAELYSHNLGAFKGSQYFPPTGHGNGDMLVDRFERGTVTVMQYSQLA